MAKNKYVLCQNDTKILFTIKNKKQRIEIHIY
jgi:hypothetical protein